MKTTTISLVALLSATAALAQQSSATAGERPPLQQVPANQAPAAVTQSGQQLYSPEERTVIPPAQARQVVDRFAGAYDKLGRPRILFFVNRDLVDTQSGVKLTRRTERTEAERGEIRSDVDASAAQNAPQTQVNVNLAGQSASVAQPPVGRGTTTRSSERVTGENTYEAKQAPQYSLADRQTVRDVERLFGRPFRAAGAQLADQGVATSLIAEKSFDHFTASGSDQARRDREALAKVADVVIEVLISSREVLVPRVSEDRVFTVPDIQATAIRLSDSAILGQASSRDILREREPGRVILRFNVHEIAEATALALMDDIAMGRQ